MTLQRFVTAVLLLACGLAAAASATSIGVSTDFTHPGTAGGATQGNTTASRKLLKKAKATRQQQQDATSGIDEAGNQWWWAGHWHLYSPGGTFQAKFQSDGNLVIYDEKSGKAVWRAGTEARPDKKKKQGVKMIFYTPKSDPPLVSYGRRESAGYPHWSESSNYKAKSGILAIVDYAGRHLWSSAGDPDEHGVPQNVWYIKYEERVPLVSAGPFELVLSDDGILKCLTTKPEESDVWYTRRYDDVTWLYTPWSLRTC